MAHANETEVVWMILGARGPGGRQLPPFTRQVLPRTNALGLIRAKKAVPYRIPAPAGELPAAPEVTSSEVVLPGDFPARDVLEAAGITTLDAVPRAEDDLRAIEGIGPTFARRILARLEGEE